MVLLTTAIHNSKYRALVFTTLSDILVTLSDSAQLTQTDFTLSRRITYKQKLAWKCTNNIKLQIVNYKCQLHPDENIKILLMGSIYLNVEKFLLLHFRSNSRKSI